MPVFNTFNAASSRSLRGSGIQIRITSQPQNHSVIQGNSATLSVTATAATGTLKYQWRRSSRFSAYLDGVSDYLYIGKASDINPGTGDFTAEIFIYPTADIVGTKHIMGNTYAYGNTWNLEISSSTISFFDPQSTLPKVSASFDFSKNTWYHIAISRISGVAYLFVNGFLLKQISYAVDFFRQWTPLIIGVRPIGYGSLGSGRIDGSTHFEGYVSNVRFVKGQSLYSSNFSVPTSPLSTTSQNAIESKVSLLGLQHPSDASTFLIREEAPASGSFMRPVSPFSLEMQNIAGATNSSYSALSEDYVGSHNIDCVITSEAGNQEITNTATLTVTPNTVAVTTQPVNISFNAGATGSSIRLTAGGTATSGGVSYQWRTTGINQIPLVVSGATGASYDVPHTQVGSYAYDCVISPVKAGKSIITSRVTATVTNPVTILQEPGNQTIVIDNSATFSVNATAFGTLTYQWKKDNVDIPGATGTSYTTPVQTALGAAGSYSCVIRATNGGATATTLSATLNVNPPAINITTQPSSTTRAINDSNTFSVAANTSSGGLGYQWQQTVEWPSGLVDNRNGFEAIWTDTNGTNLVTSNHGIVYVSNNSGSSWSARGTPNVNFATMAISNDGVYILGKAVSGGQREDVWVSTDSGVSWSSKGQLSWSSGGANSCAMSSDGRVMIVAHSYSVFPDEVDSDGPVYLSTDYGSTWNKITAIGDRDWKTVRVSSDGTKITIISWDRGCFKSTDSGSTWTNINSGLPWELVSMDVSADHSKIFITPYYEPKIYYSSNAGASWSSINYPSSMNPVSVIGVTSTYAVSIAVSDNGTNIVLAAAGSNIIWTSSNSGATWIARDSLRLTWGNLQRASNGTILYARGYFSIFKSTNSGANWSMYTPKGNRPTDEFYNIDGATSTTYTVTERNAGTYIYRCFIYNASYPVNTVTNNATLTVVDPTITITFQPSNATVAINTNKIFSVTANAAAGTLTYQWRLNGSNISGATSSTYTATQATTGTYTYSCVVTNASYPSYTATSNNASLTVVDPTVSITSQPSSTTAIINTSNTFSVTASAATGTLSYQWRLNGVNISEATSSTYTATQTTVGSYTYSCVVTNVSYPSFTATSDNATLTVVDPTITITSQPSNATVAINTNKIFSVTANAAAGTLTYQWRLNESNISGATSSTYTATQATAGSYTYSCVVTNASYPSFTATSDNATLTVVDPTVSITSQPSSTAAIINTNKIFSVTANAAAGTLTYQWRLNESNISGATSSTYTATQATAGSYTYSCVVTNASYPSFTATSDNATLTVLGTVRQVVPSANNTTHLVFAGPSSNTTKYISTDSGSTFTSLPNAPSSQIWGNDGSWAISNNGLYIVGKIPSGDTWFSTNAGNTWTARGTVTENGGNNNAVGMSSDGRVMVALNESALTGGLNGPAYISTDYGNTWSIITAVGNQNWRAVRINSDGTKITMLAWNSKFFTSVDSGNTWTDLSNKLPIYKSFVDLSVSEDHSIVYTTPWELGIVYRSSNSGQTWNTHTIPGVSGGGYGTNLIECSSDGSNLTYVTDPWPNPNQFIYTSSDSGATWTARSGQAARKSLKSASDSRNNLFVFETNSSVKKSTNFGVDWTEYL